MHTGNLLGSSNLRIREDRRTTVPETPSSATNTSSLFLVVPQQVSFPSSSPQALTSSVSLLVPNEDFDSIMEDDYKTYFIAGSGRAATGGSHEEEDHAVEDDSSEVVHDQPSLPQQADPIKEKRKRKPPLVPWKKPKDMPRRPLSAYNLFFKERREAMMLLSSTSLTPIQGRSEESIHSSQGPKPARKKKSGKSVGIGFANLARTIASEWKELDQESKSPYEAIASSDKDRYDREMLLWRAKQKEEKDNLVTGVATASPPPTGVMGDTAASKISVLSSMEGQHRLTYDMMGERVMSMANASPASSDRRNDEDPVTFSVAERIRGLSEQHPSSMTHMQHVIGSDASTSFHNMGNMMIMDRTLHQSHEQSLLGDQQIEFSMMMQETQQEQHQQGSPFATTSGLSPIQMSENSCAAFLTQSQQQNRMESPFVGRQHLQRQMPDQGHRGRFTDQNNLFNPSFRRNSMEASSRNHQGVAVPMIGTIDEQAQHQHVPSLPFNFIGGFEGGEYAADSQFWHSSPDLDYHQRATLMEDREDLGKRQMESMMYAARRNTWSGMSQAQQKAFQQQMIFDDLYHQQQQEYQQQLQQEQYPLRRATIREMTHKVVASGSASRPFDLLSQQQQQMSQQVMHEQGSLASGTMPDSWMESSPERPGASNQAAQLLPAQENRGVQQHHGQDPILAYQWAASERTNRGQSSGGVRTVYPDTWFEADANMTDTGRASGTPEESEPIRYSPDGELNQKLPSRPSTKIASRDRLTSTLLPISDKAELKASQGGFGKGRKRMGLDARFSSTKHDIWKPVNLKSSPLGDHKNLSQPLAQHHLEGSEGTDSSLADNFNQEGQQLNPSSLQVLGMRLDEESVDFLTTLRFNNMTGASDHSSSTPTDD